MTETKTVVNYYDHYGNEVEYSVDNWNKHYTGNMRNYIGSCIQVDDKVGFSGNEENGSLTIHDGSETVFSCHWITEEVKVFDENETMYDHVLEYYDFYA